MHFLGIADLLIILSLGATLGFFGGLFGIGGGIIAIPLLALAFGMEQAVAQGTSLAMMVPILVVGFWRYSRRHPIPWKTALQIGLLASITTFLVAHIATRLEPGLLRVVFGGFLLLLSLSRLIHHRAAAVTEGTSRFNPKFVPLVGILGGTAMGLLGIGGGLVATPFLTACFGQRQTVAQSLSLALVTPCSIIALITYSSAGCVDWSMGLPLAVGGLFTVSSGVALAHRMPEQRMRIAFAWMILCTAIWLLLKPFVLN